MASNPLYSTSAWKRIRRAQLRDHPLCAMCLADGRIAAAAICDHVHRHGNDPVKFYSGPFQSLCKAHHDSAKQRDELRGYVGGCDATGAPLDKGSHWNR